MDELPALEVSELGGDLAVDFFNTVDWRLHPARRSERITSFAHLLAWMRHATWLGEVDADRLLALSAESPQTAAAEHAEALRLREEVYTALCDGGPLVVLGGRLAEALTRLTLTPQDDGRWAWRPTAPDLHTPADLLALEMHRLLTSAEVARFGRCDDDACGWVFLDTSRQHNRRWCSAADCGNRNRVRAHYRRSQAGAARPLTDTGEARAR